jgi:Protein of unknown function (DUF3485)
MLRPLPVIVAFVLVASSGLVHGLWTERWQKSDALTAACARVDQMPLDFGAWKGKALEVDAEEFAQAGAEAYWMRQYTRKDRSLTVLLMCGRAGRMSVHTPEFCYQGLGYQMTDAAVKKDVVWGTAAKAEFWTARFSKQRGLANDLRLVWGWNGGDRWQAPASPRWEFRGRPWLYKLYIVHETSGPERLEDDAAFEFLKDFLPELASRLNLHDNGTGAFDVSRQ